MGGRGIDSEFHALTRTIYCTFNKGPGTNDRSAHAESGTMDRSPCDQVSALKLRALLMSSLLKSDYITQH